MRQRLTITLAATALVLAALATTPLGQAAATVVRHALYADNAGKVDGLKASKTPRPGKLLALGRDAKFPASVGAVGPQGPPGPPGPPGPVPPAPAGWLRVLGPINGVGSGSYVVISAVNESASSQNVTMTFRSGNDGSVLFTNTFSLSPAQSNGRAYTCSPTSCSYGIVLELKSQSSDVVPAGCISSSAPCFAPSEEFGPGSWQTIPLATYP